jgi:hypothetical protein
MPRLLERAAAFAYLLRAAALPWSIAPMSIAVVLCGAFTLAAWWSPGGARWVRTPIDLPALGWLAALVIATVASSDPAASAPRITKGFLRHRSSRGVPRSRSQLARAVAVLLCPPRWPPPRADKFAAHGGAFPARVRAVDIH